MLKSHEETILATVLRVTESRTRGTWAHPDGRRQFQIEAVRVADPTDHLWCSTLDAWAASLCERVSQTPKQLLLTVRAVTLYGRFSSQRTVWNLLHVEQPREQVSA